MKKMCKKT